MIEFRCKKSQTMKTFRQRSKKSDDQIPPQQILDNNKVLCVKQESDNRIPPLEKPDYDEIPSEKQKVVE